MTETKLLTPEDEIIKQRIAMKMRFPMSEIQWRKKMELMGFDWAKSRLASS